MKHQLILVRQFYDDVTLCLQRSLLPKLLYNGEHYVAWSWNWEAIKFTNEIPAERWIEQDSASDCDSLLSAEIVYFYHIWSSKRLLKKLSIELKLHTKLQQETAKYGSWSDILMAVCQGTPTISVVVFMFQQLYPVFTIQLINCRDSHWCHLAVLIICQTGYVRSSSWLKLFVIYTYFFVVSKNHKNSCKNYGKILQKALKTYEYH